jgi:hypothetical protein
MDLDVPGVDATVGHRLGHAVFDQRFNAFHPPNDALVEKHLPAVRRASQHCEDGGLVPRQRIEQTGRRWGGCPDHKIIAVDPDANAGSPR